MTEMIQGNSAERLGTVRENDRLDETALSRWMSENIAGCSHNFEIAQFRGGASNPTFLLTDKQTDRRFVLRKQPPGRLLQSAHAIDREYRVMAALGPVDVPVPRMLAFCENPTIVGTPFYVMPFIEGRIYKDNRMSDMSPVERGAAYSGLAQTLAAIHAVDIDASGLADFGSSGNYYERQITRWTQQYRRAATEPIPAMERVIEALPTRVPAEATRGLVHGDFRMENVMFAPDRPEVIAVLDWELSTLGDPLADVAFFCLFYHADFMPWGSATTIDFAASGIPTEARFVELYSAAAGREAIEDWAFYLGFAAFRVAAIAQGVYARSLAGNARAHSPANGALDWAPLAERLLDGAS